MNSQKVSLEALAGLVESVRGEPVPGTFGPETRFVQDLGLASLELIGLVYLCEQTFGIGLVTRPGLLATLATVGQTVAAIEQLQCSGECVSGPANIAVGNASPGQQPPA